MDVCSNVSALEGVGRLGSQKFFASRAPQMFILATFKKNKTNSKEYCSEGRPTRKGTQWLD